MCWFTHWVLGHACALLITNGVTCEVDPLVISHGGSLSADTKHVSASHRGVFHLCLTSDRRITINHVRYHLLHSHQTHCLNQLTCGTVLANHASTFVSKGVLTFTPQLFTREEYLQAYNCAQVKSSLPGEVAYLITRDWLHAWLASSVILPAYQYHCWILITPTPNIHCAWVSHVSAGSTRVNHHIPWVFTTLHGPDRYRSHAWFRKRLLKWLMCHTTGCGPLDAGRGGAVCCTLPSWRKTHGEWRVSHQIYLTLQLTI